MKVVVAVPAYNCAPTLAATMESLRAQSYSDFSVVVYNNGSTDGSGEVAEHFCSTHGLSHWRVVHKAQPGGMTRDWNEALATCGGDAVKLLPGDDLLGPRCLVRQVQILTEHPEVGWVVCQKHVIDARGRRLRYLPPLPEGRLRGESLRRRLLASPVNRLGETGAGLMRRTVLDAVGVFDEDFQYYPDLDFWLRMLDRADGYYLPGEDYFFRAHGGSLTATNRGRAAGEYVALCRKHGRCAATRTHTAYLAYKWLQARVMADLRVAYLKLAGSNGRE